MWKQRQALFPHQLSSCRARAGPNSASGMGLNACVIVCKELLHLRSRTEQCKSLFPIIERKYSDDLAVVVINGTAGKTILPINFYRPVLGSAESIGAIKSPAPDHFLFARLSDQKQLLILAGSRSKC